MSAGFLVLTRGGKTTANFFWVRVLNKLFPALSDCGAAVAELDGCEIWSVLLHTLTKLYNSASFIFPYKTLPLQPAARSAFQNCAHQGSLSFRPLQVKLCTCALGNAAKPAFVGFLVILVPPITLFRTLFSIDFYSGIGSVEALYWMP